MSLPAKPTDDDREDAKSLAILLCLDVHNIAVISAISAAFAEARADARANERLRCYLIAKEQFDMADKIFEEKRREVASTVTTVRDVILEASNRIRLDGPQ